MIRRLVSVQHEQRGSVKGTAVGMIGYWYLDTSVYLALFVSAAGRFVILSVSTAVLKRPKMLLTYICGAT